MLLKNLIKPPNIPTNPKLLIISQTLPLTDLILIHKALHHIPKFALLSIPHLKFAFPVLKTPLPLPFIKSIIILPLPPLHISILHPIPMPQPPQLPAPVDLTPVRIILQNVLIFCINFNLTFLNPLFPGQAALIYDTIFFARECVVDYYSVSGIIFFGRIVTFIDRRWGLCVGN